MLGTWLHKKTYWFRCIQCIMAKTEDDKPTHLPTILWNWQLWDVYCYPDDKAAADLRSVFGPYLHSSLSSAFTGPSIKDPHCSLLKTWPLRCHAAKHYRRFILLPFHLCVCTYRTGPIRTYRNGHCSLMTRAGMVLETFFFAIHPPDAAARPIIFYWIRSLYSF